MHPSRTSTPKPITPVAEDGNSTCCSKHEKCFLPNGDSNKYAKCHEKCDVNNLNKSQKHNVNFIIAYFLLGVLHEVCHLLVVSSLLPTTRCWDFWKDQLANFAARAIIGRQCSVNISPLGGGSLPPLDSSLIEAAEWTSRHSGWIFSLLLAIGLHLCHAHLVENVMPASSTSSKAKLAARPAIAAIMEPAVVIAAYVTAAEAISTDLLGLIPAYRHSLAFLAKFRPEIQPSGESLVFFCGNFGILLLNSSWINVDGGRRALDMLEKMVNVTMMRGAQSGGVVTFEPTQYGKLQNNSSALDVPALKGIRSRVVNAKRTDLSKGIRAKIVKDNCNLSGNLRGWKSKEFNGTSNDPTKGETRIVRGFFGHTRFATSSKASFDGTHPHQWSPRKMYRLYTFQSASAYKTDRKFIGDDSANGKPQSSLRTSQRQQRHAPPKPQLMAVETYVTHNGDFEFYKVNNKYYDVEAIQKWLAVALSQPIPTTVDSAAIAGMMDLLRTQGNFALSARYALCLQMGNSKVSEEMEYPKIEGYDEVGKIFEKVLYEYMSNKKFENLEEISAKTDERKGLEKSIITTLLDHAEAIVSPLGNSIMLSLTNFFSFDIEDVELNNFVKYTVDAFFDNDLLHSARIFMENAKGSFGLCVTTSMDAHRQVCFAARGQTCSVAFYPRKGIICYGSEQAAVKAGLNYETPHGKIPLVDEDAVRLDLDDLGGEICLLDWGYANDTEPSISPPNRNLAVEKLMGGSINVVLLHQSRSLDHASRLSKRLTALENNEFIKPLLEDSDDPVRADICDIPRVCHQIQEDWQDVGLNRMTAWNLANCIRGRLQGHVDETIKNYAAQVDILVTGCEVSLWVAEQFISDLQKCFPQLYIKAVSSNKLLGLFGQELTMPCIGFPISQKSMDLTDPIVIIVSHSGGTFGPLACSNLLQSFSSSIFAVTSEWDTQVGKQLRNMNSDKIDLLSSRIFSTEVGVRPAEPCSVSVVATHQLLTNIFEHICITIISDPHFRYISGAIVTERDLQTLERCNQENIKALEEIVGVDRKGNELHELRGHTEKELREAGDVWAEHVLENVKAYMMSFVYIMVTVTSGYPIISGIATAAGLKTEWAFYITRFLDAWIYFWLPQINIFILRLIQGRNLRHRMVGRTVVVGDIPWVAQSAEAFLGKIFACAYSIAGINVLSGNPADHLVHRHTHRVVRGSLFVCGRPDGRLSALTTLESSTCLAVNQASSIQSLGGTCESVTIGHNPSKLPLSKQAIYLNTHRPLFLCEKVLGDMDAQEELGKSIKIKPKDEKMMSMSWHGGVGRSRKMFRSGTARFVSRRNTEDDNLSSSQHSGVARSSASLLGAYVNLEKDAKKKANQGGHGQHNVSEILHEMIKKRQGIEHLRQVFNEIDDDGNGYLDWDEFVSAYKRINPDVSTDHLKTMFEEADIDGSGTLEFDEFLKVAKMPQTEVLAKLSVKNRDFRGLVRVQPSKENYFGEELRKSSPTGVGSFAMSQSQHLSMELYESRIASMQRFVAMTVMFHQMGMRVQTFFPKISFGLLGYRMDRTHSIMRIATTASPVSGADVRDRMVELRIMLKIEKSVALIARTWKKWKSVRSFAEKWKNTKKLSLKQDSNSCSAKKPL